MNAPLHGYGASSPVFDARGAEAAILRRITGRIATASAPMADPSQMIGALDDNRRYWMQAAIDLAGPGNGLPEALRAALISMAGFTARHTSRVLAGEASAEPLIAINSAIIRGLNGESA